MFARDVAADIEYGLLRHDEVDAMVILLAETFSMHEPPAVAVGLSASQLQRLVAAFVPNAVTEQLTVVARELSTGQLLGAILALDFETPAPPELEIAAPSFAPIGALLDSLDNEYRATRSIEPGTHLHLFMVAVADRATGRGIASRLIASCLSNGKNRGYMFAVTEATGSISQHVFTKLGFKGLLTASYKTFLFDGVAVFSSIAEPEGTILMEREL